MRKTDELRIEAARYLLKDYPPGMRRSKDRADELLTGPGKWERLALTRKLKCKARVLAKVMSLVHQATKTTKTDVQHALFTKSSTWHAIPAPVIAWNPL